jgi:dTDP-4-amino-4,6-dideoxygalactose transaminase
MQPSKRPPQSQFNRRDFLKTSSAAVAGLAVAAPIFAQGGRQALASDGGAKTVTYDEKRHTALMRWPRYGDAEKQAVCAVIDGSKFYDELAKFEKEWQTYLKAPFVKSHMNGTSALTSMFFALSLDLPPGSEIMVPSYTFFATIVPMRFFGFVPVFIDIDPRTACFDLDDAKRKLTKDTRALIPMHSWGMPCEMDKINDWAKQKGLIVCEDAAHAHGATLGGKHVSTLSDMAIFSFQASKVMPTIEGGMGIYATREYYERATAFGHYEAPPKFPENSPYRKYDGTGFGQKYRMHPLSAAIGRVQLKGLDAMNAGVNRRVRGLNQQLTQLAGLSEPWIRPDIKRVYYAINMLLLDEKKAGFTRNQVMKALQAEGVKFGGFAGGYPEQHKFHLYSEAKWWHHPIKVPAVLPGTAQVNATALHLPLFYEDVPELDEQYVKAFEKVWANKDNVAKIHA